MRLKNMGLLRKFIRWLFNTIKKPYRGIDFENLMPDTFPTSLEPSPYDSRDEEYAVKVGVTELPASVMLENVPAVKSQGGLNSCASHAFATMTEMLCMKNDKAWDDIPLSERFHYYVVRSKDYENSYPKDEGQYMRDGAKVCAQVGISPEVLCPYDESKFNDQPGYMAYGFAPLWKLKTYNRCWDVQSIKAVLANLDPVAFGIYVYSDVWITPSTGDLQFTGHSIGGHAITAVGYSDTHSNPDGTEGAIYFVNSWGRSWGRNGYGWVSYNQLTNNFLEAWSGTV